MRMSSLFFCLVAMSTAAFAQITVDPGLSMLLTGGGPGQDALPAGLDGDLQATVSTRGGACNVRVMNAENDVQVRGFGLNANREATVLVAAGERLLIDAEDKKVRVDVVYKPAPAEAQEAGTAVTFTLHNSSLRSIPLRIPGVMNPNLSPRSNSGVRLSHGQNILHKGQVILTVGPEIEEGSVIDVAKLIRKRP